MVEEEVVVVEVLLANIILMVQGILLDDLRMGTVKVEVDSEEVVMGEVNVEEVVLDEVVEMDKTTEVVISISYPLSPHHCKNSIFHIL